MSFSGRLSVRVEMLLEEAEVELVEQALIRILEERALSFNEVLDFTVSSERYTG